MTENLFKMKLTFLFSVVLLILGSWAIKPKEEIPPGTIKFAKDCFVDETEVTNFNWSEYLYWQKLHFGEESAEYQETLPDTAVWKGVSDSLVMYYLRHPSYRYYPVVGITLKQAQAFCEWRSNRVNEYIYIRDHKLKIHKGDSLPDKCPKKFKYRIPTQAEWNEFSNIAFTDKTLKSMAKHNMSFGHFHIEKASNDTTLITLLPVYSYFPNGLGLYNSFGNAGELTNENIVMGGSWCHSKAEPKLFEGQQYVKPTNWIGFRCVCDRIRVLK